MARFTSSRLNDLVTTFRAHLDEVVADYLEEGLAGYTEAIRASDLEWATTQAHRIEGATYFVRWLLGSYTPRQKATPLVTVNMNDLSIKNGEIVVKEGAGLVTFSSPQ